MNDNGSLFNDDDLFGSAEPVVRETRQPEPESAPYAARYSNSRIKPISLDGLNPMQREAAEHVDGPSHFKSWRQSHECSGDYLHQ
jgi:hypothetical protein